MKLNNLSDLDDELAPQKRPDGQDHAGIDDVLRLRQHLRTDQRRAEQAQRQADPAAASGSQEKLDTRSFRRRPCFLAFHRHASFVLQPMPSPAG